MIFFLTAVIKPKVTNNLFSSSDEDDPVKKIISLPEKRCKLIFKSILSNKSSLISLIDEKKAVTKSNLFSSDEETDDIFVASQPPSSSKIRKSSYREHDSSTSSEDDSPEIKPLSLKKDFVSHLNNDEDDDIFVASQPPSSSKITKSSYREHDSSTTSADHPPEIKSMSSKKDFIAHLNNAINKKGPNSLVQAKRKGLFSSGSDEESLTHEIVSKPFEKKNNLLDESSDDDLFMTPSKVDVKIPNVESLPTKNSANQLEKVSTLNNNMVKSRAARQKRRPPSRRPNRADATKSNVEIVDSDG